MRQTLFIIGTLSILLHQSAVYAENSATDSKGPSSDLYHEHFIATKATNAPREAFNGEPHLYLGQDKVLDKTKMEERGFELIGYADFQAPEMGPDQVIPEAKRVHAEAVLVYSERVDHTPSSVKVQQMKSGNKDGNESAHVYRYFASFWAKLSKPSLGVHVEIPEKGSHPEGLTVLVVVDDSPAKLAGMEEGDLLLNIGDISLKSVDDLSSALKRYAGKTVKVKFKRDEATQEQVITLR
jgi:PDZ domain